jgi:hypothetical protein
MAEFDDDRALGQREPGGRDDNRGGYRRRQNQFMHEISPPKTGAGPVCRAFMGWMSH